MVSLKCIQSLFFNEYGGHSTLGFFCSFFYNIRFRKRHGPRYVTAPCVAFCVRIDNKNDLKLMVCREYVKKYFAVDDAINGV